MNRDDHDFAGHPAHPLERALDRFLEWFVIGAVVVCLGLATAIAFAGGFQ